MPDLHPGALLDRGDHPADHVLRSLCLHNDRTVILILHPACDAIFLGGLSGSPSEAHALDFTGKNKPHPDRFVRR